VGDAPLPLPSEFDARADMTSARLTRPLRSLAPDPGILPRGAVVIGGDFQGLGIARSLGRHGIPVVVLDDERSVASASRFVRKTFRVPSLLHEGETIDALTALSRRTDVEGWVLYPTRDETVAAISHHKAWLSQLYRVPVPAWKTIQFAWDKRETYRLAERLSIPTPRTWFLRGEEDLSTVDSHGPLVIKPAIKEHFFYATHAKAWRADSRAQLARLYRQASSIAGGGEILVQELIPGSGRQQFSYCAFFKDGAPRASMTVERRRQHPSDFGRASTYVETVELDALDEPSRRFLEAIDYYGLVELEYKLDPRDGVFKLLDVNARTWGYHSIGQVAGVDFPYLLFLDQLGHEVAPARARPGIRWIRWATDIPNAFVDIRSGTLAARPYLRSLRRVQTEAVFSWRDPLPGLYELALLPYLFFKRGL